MDIRRIDDTLSVTSQIAPEALPDIAAQGFRAIICNRPDGEGADQPPFAAIAAAAEAEGLTARYIPVVSGAMTAEDVSAFAAARQELPAPVLAYCRSGARSTALANAAG